MARPMKHGGKAAREALRYIDPYLSHVLDLMSDELNFRQRYQLRVYVLEYVVNGRRRRSKDHKTQEVYKYLIVNYINPYETL